MSEESQHAFEGRLAKIEKLERELLEKASSLFTSDTNIYHSDMFILGAVRRTVAQAAGFRGLISSRNFPCAAGILRMQIDTAMRVNGLLLVRDRNAFCAAILSGTQFNKLKDADGNKLTDAYLRQRLAAQHPWVNEVYEQTSDFVHLSGRHCYNSIAKLDDEIERFRCS